MALHTCHECGKSISSQAERCPHCGAPVLSTAGKAFIIGKIAVALLVLYGLWQILSSLRGLSSAFGH